MKKKRKEITHLGGANHGAMLIARSNWIVELSRQTPGSTAPDGLRVQVRRRNGEKKKERVSGGGGYN